MEKEKEGAEGVMPYDSRRRKGEQVEEMFDSIAPAYDFMNTAMTFGLHRLWRRTALSALRRRLGKAADSYLEILDIATGTGDVAFHLARLFPEALVVGADISEGMLSVARRKLAEADDEVRCRMKFTQADCLALPFSDSTFEAVTVAYGVRNFQELESGYREMHRVLMPGGVLCVIELSSPRGGLSKALYDVYSRRLIPAVGKMVSGDGRAYSYLPESIAAAPQREAMADVMRRAGFADVSWRSLTFGAVTLYFAVK